MVEDCTVIIKKHFNKELVMTKEDDEDLKCWICDHDYVDSDIEVRDQSYYWKI